MKQDIHPEYVETHVTCSCGNTFTTRSVKSELHVELCNKCHPFYTGKQKLVDTGGRVERFQRKYAQTRARAETVAAQRAAKAESEQAQPAAEAPPAQPPPAAEEGAPDQEQPAPEQAPAQPPE